MRANLVDSGIMWAGSLNRETNNDANNPALLFIKSNTTNMPQIYLFSNFGLAQSAEIGQQSQITTHYTEQNNAINDHWAISPLTFTLSGLIGEVVYTPPTKWANYVARQTTEMSALINLLAVPLDANTSNAYNIAQFANANVRRYTRTIAQNLSKLGIIKTQTRKTNQQYVFEQLRNLQTKRQLLAVETPYGTFEDMAIINVRMSQSGNRFYSQVSVDFQQWRDVLPANQRAATSSEKTDIARLQQAAIQNQGNASTQTEEIHVSSLKKLYYSATSR